MSRFGDMLRGHGQDSTRQLGQGRWGTVTTVDPVNYLVRVEIQPEGVQTGWLPVTSQAVGAGWGLSMLPTAGQQVFVQCDNGDADHGVVMGGTYSTQNMPAQTPPIPGAGATPAQPGEFLMTHASGSSLRFNNDGTVFLNTAGDLHAQVGGMLQAQVVGAATIASEVSVTISAPVIGLDAPAVTGQQSGATVQRLATESFVLSTYANHVHISEAPGTPTSSPTTGAAAADLTTNFKGS